MSETTLGVIIVSPTGRRWRLPGAQCVMRQTSDAPLGWWPWVRLECGRCVRVPSGFRFKQCER